MTVSVLEREVGTRLAYSLAAWGISDRHVSSSGRIVTIPGEQGTRWLRVRRYAPESAIRVDLDRSTGDTTPPPSDAGSAGSCSSVGAVDRLRAVLTDLAVGEDVAETLTALVVGCATVSAGCPSSAPGSADGRESFLTDLRAGDVDPMECQRVRAHGQDLLEALGALTGAAGHLDALLLTATRDLTAVHARLLLAEKDAVSPEELTRAQREKWRARAKKLTREEIGAAIGWGPGEVRDLVSLANTPVSVTTPVQRALSTGEASWKLVRGYQRACAGLATEDAAAISNGLFGDDPDQAVTERLDSDGDWVGGPWRHKEFYRALDRETHKIKSRDPENQQKTRERARAEADVRVLMDEGGTAKVTIGCAPTQGAAIADRIEKAARAARQAGDPRTLRELRVAVATALLLHGALTMDDLPDDPDLITVEQSAQLTKVLHGLPTAELNVIVPLNTLLGIPPEHLCPRPAPPPDTPHVPAIDAEGRPIPAAFARPTQGRPSAGGVQCTCECTCGAERSPTKGSAAEPCPPTEHVDDPCSPTEHVDDPCSPTKHPDDPCSPTKHLEGSLPPATHTDGPCPLDPADVRPSPADDASGEVGVGEVIGAHALFLSAEEVRTLALTPGTTLFRLLTDPATGALVERSTRAYKFDKAMRAHVIAADVFCRAPGCLRPASLAQLDHVQEFGTAGGHTCIGNAQPLDPSHHDLKTKKHWDAVIDANRDVTWTTMLGRIYRTKAHDYRQYTTLLTAATIQVSEAIEAGTTSAEAIDDAIYQALSYRTAGSPLQAPDDDPWADEEFTGWDLVVLSHTNPATGRRVYRPDPETTRREATRHRDTLQQTEPHDEHAAPEDPDPSTQRPTDEHTTDRGTTDAGTTDAGGADRDGATDTGSTDIESSDATDGGPSPEQPGDGPTTPWSRDPDEPPPF